MIRISHRGNLFGPDPLRDNRVKAIEEVLRLGYHCEVDIRLVNGNYWLGHDEPQENVPLRFLQNECLWVHAKDGPTFVDLVNKGVHTFFHDRDPYTLTSKGHIWAYPSFEIAGCISVKPEISGFTLADLVSKKCVGACSDNIAAYS